MAQQVGFVGLGTMGRPMVRRLLEAGFSVTVWNRSPEPVEELVAEGARAAADLPEVFALPLVLSMLADDRAVRERLLDPALLAGASTAVHVNMATVSPELAAEAAGVHAEHGIGYVAAPVMGRSDVAAAGRLNVLASGAPVAVARARPALESFAARVWGLGDDPSRANVVKIAVNFLLGAAVEATAEATALVEAYGVTASDFVELISNSIFPGPVYGGYGGLMASRSYEPAGFAAQLALKDTRLALDAAGARSVALPVAGVVEDALSHAVDRGWAGRDLATLGEVARERATGENAPA